MDQQQPIAELGHARDFATLLGFCGGLLVGFCIGASSALIYAPQNGEETRGQLRDVSQQVKDHAGALQGRVQETLGQVKQRVQRHADTTAESADSVLADGVIAGDVAQASDQGANPVAED